MAIMAMRMASNVNENGYKKASNGYNGYKNGK